MGPEQRRAALALPGHGDHLEQHGLVRPIAC
jgi:hypothetical protein